ncbi:MAG TPA: ATP-binding protein, partial [Polyangiaceae bacterium]|nr:ATP-binding protein [Polyangiaceae bacterium]
TDKRPDPANPATEVDVKLEDLIDREGLAELCQSFFTLFGIPVRVLSHDGTLLADASREHEVCNYINTLASGRAACGATVGAVKISEPDESGTLVHPCFSGQQYRIVSIDYEARRIGRFILGPYLPAELAEVPDSLLEVDPKIDHEKARSLLIKVPRAKSDTVQRVARHLKAALDLILFSGHKTLLTSQMHLLSVRESFRELTEKQAKLQDAYDRLKELDRLKSNFLATVSHELRTPLTSIIGYSEMLGEGISGPLNPEQQEFVGTIREKGEQLLSLIQSLLDMGKLESGTMSVRRAHVRIEDVLGEVLKTLTPTARKKGVLLKLEGQGNLPELRADAERLRQVFTNIGDNAIKFTPQGGSVTLRTRLLSRRDGQEVGLALMAPLRAQIEIAVLDTGIGIPPGERDKVFDPFYQVDSSSTREYGGTGLGLAIVKRLVEAHNGTIRVEENRPQGAVFVVALPVAAAEELS